jgi:hypothetical protein
MAVHAVETGMMRQSASISIQAGFISPRSSPNPFDIGVADLLSLTATFEEVASEALFFVAGAEL